MTPQIVGRYPQIKLGRDFQVKIHVLVLNAFVGDRPVGLEARHLDGDPTNDHLSNLKWGTQAENYDDRRRHGTANDGERHGNAKLTNAQVREIRRSTERIDALAARFGVSRVTVWSIRGGRSWRNIK